jgi:iron(III) transport system substrate-binding protein
VAHLGEEKTEAWARGLVANLARAPKGGDTDQIRAVAAGECQVALANSYYVARLLRSDKPEDREVVSRIAVVWPNQKTTGTHVNVSGGGVLKTAPHREAAVKFLEYLASDAAQAYFANGNNEWPAVSGVKVDNPALQKLGTFRPDPLNVGTLAKNTAVAQKIYDRAGWR